jgi:hypothetical protein
MFENGMLNFVARLIVIPVLLVVMVSPAKGAELTQRDWMITLIDALGWSYGLPDEPLDSDYINIMTGSRELRVEAEDSYDKETDNVSVMSFQNFGAFSGSGWLNGRRLPTETHLRFNLPIDGEYTVRARLRQPGHEVRIGATTIPIDGPHEFTEATIGSFYFDAGPNEIIVILPPDGSIDYITLSAPSHALITPEDGWDLDAPLSWGTINTTLLQLFNLADIFPLAPDSLKIEAESYEQAGTKVVTAAYLGPPSEGKWLRAAAQSAEVEIPLHALKSGFYNLSLRVMGDPIIVVIDGHHTIEIAAKAYLDNFTFPALYFTGGDSNITITLPPGGGIDQLQLTENLVDMTQTRRLFDMAQEQSPSAQDLDSISSLLAAFGVNR